jgi:3-phenylpropionate/trans-cinnamate dioxygenase ferredoxin reductase component
MQSTVAIVGAGQAGFQVAASLRELHWDGRIVLIGDEPHAPYQRPPLSKAFLLGDMEDARLALRPDAFYADRRVELLTGRRAVAISRAERSIALDDGSTLAYQHLVLATGARNRPLPAPGVDLDGVFFLRTLHEASALRARLAGAKSAVVIGAGFIGLEFAASAVKLGLEVTVLDVADRPMARALSRTMSAVFVREHEKLGVRLLFNTQVSRLIGEAGRVVGVQTANGQVLPADLVMVGVGVLPNSELAAACGLQVDNGVVVDEFMRTSDPHVSAVGDLAAHPNPHANGRRIRLESVQNATDQARCAAAAIAGRPAAYAALPWFWSTQGPLKLQMAGLPPVAGGEEVVRGERNSSTCSVFIFESGKLVCVESLNRAADHMLARRLLAEQAAVTPQQAADSGFDLKSLLQKPAASAATG